MDLTSIRSHRQLFLLFLRGPTLFLFLEHYQRSRHFVYPLHVSDPARIFFPCPNHYLSIHFGCSLLRISCSVNSPLKWIVLANVCAEYNAHRIHALALLRLQCNFTHKTQIQKVEHTMRDTAYRMWCTFSSTQNKTVTRQATQRQAKTKDKTKWKERRSSKHNNIHSPVSTQSYNSPFHYTFI